MGIRIDLKKYCDLKRVMQQLNDSQDAGFNKNIRIRGFILFTEDSFQDQYTEEQRTYWFTNDNKAFKANMGGYSIFGSCIDGSDRCVRLEAYIQGEMGNWQVEKCWIVIAEGDIL